MTSAVLITGAPGAGKSSLLDALATLLEIQGIEHGAIESEELTRGFPPLSNELLPEPLGRVIELQRVAGRELFLVVFTAETAAQLRTVALAVAAERTLSVALRASAEEVASRLGAREPDSWPGKAGLIAHARQLAAVAPELPGVEVVLETAGRAAEDLAQELLAAMRERGIVPQ